MIEIFPGAFHFPKSIDKFENDYLVNLHAFYKSKMYVPKLASGHSMNLKMVSLGKHWNAIDYKYYDTRTDVDKLPTPPYPHGIDPIGRRFSLKAFPYLNPSWDICNINYYDSNSTLGMHVDNSESEEALRIGHPVISFTVGGSCIFRVGGLNRKDEYKDVKLDDGDVFVFGGLSRLRYHGVIKLVDSKERINFTLRRF